MKHLIISTYVFLLILLASATIIEHHQGSAFVSDHIYHTPWFVVLWALATLLMIYALVKRKLWHRLPLLMLHLSFAVILGGGLLTYFTSTKGILHLSQGIPVRNFQSEDLSRTFPLPFNVMLDRFDIKCYPGTETPADYFSHLTVISREGIKQKCSVSMNKIQEIEGYRFYQSSYDEDGQGSWLSVNYDPWGTTLSYVGYILLAISMLLVLIDRREEFRRLLRNPLLRKGTLIIMLAAVSPSLSAASRSLPAFNREKADSLAAKQVVYNGRVAPFNTLAHDFILKLYGKDSYGGLSPEQVVSGWLLRPDVWQNEPMILIKNKELRQLLGLDGKYARLTDLFRGNEYILRRYWNGNGNAIAPSADPLQKAIAETDEKVGLIMMLQNGTLIKPLPKDGSVKPLSPQRVKAEILYNSIPTTKILFIVCFVCALISFTLMAYKSIRNLKANVLDQKILPAMLFLATAALGIAFALRWYIADHIPMSNGFETMQFMALCTLAFSSIFHHRFRILLPFGFLLGGFALLVSHLGQSNPQITNLMPVLASPWLSLHVSVIMIGYALLAFTMLTGILGLCISRQAEPLMLFGRLLLYPAVFFLGIGIFLGAVWANQSWGAYWSWDPKETWALITFMVYAIGFHSHSLPWLRSAKRFHGFCILAFLTVLMTYFGVNFFLSGMHSYAG